MSINRGVTRSGRRWRRTAAAAASITLASAGLVGIGAASAQADAPCTTTGATVTCTYSGAGTYSFTIPGGVTSLDVTAVGAAGGASCPHVCGVPAFIGGPGASVEDAAVSVGAGQTYAVVVGGVGAGGDPAGSPSLGD